jgi:hypothetical protein
MEEYSSTEKFKFTIQMEQKKVILHCCCVANIFSDPGEMARKKEFEKLQKQLKSTREAVREATEKPYPSSANVKGTLHFLKVASVSQQSSTHSRKFIRS